MSRLHVLDQLAPDEHRRFPSNDAEREVVLKQLERILAHPSFKHSRRYPNLFRYVVEHTLTGEGPLKERRLGVEVFGRDADYDTNDDPVVRITAGEIRKRIAQYYHEAGHETEPRIDLPPGSYIPEFHLPCDALAVEHAHPAYVVGVAEPSEHRSRWHFRNHQLLYICVALAIVSVAAMAWATRLSPWASSRPLDDFWGPIIESPSSTLVVIGEPSSLEPAQNVGASISDHIYGPDHIAFSDANALFHLAELLGNRGKTSRLQSANATTLTDLRQGPVVLVAGFDNEWTLRLEQSLRYHFNTSPNHTLFWVEDRNNPSREWAVDFSEKYSQLTQDYAIVSRFSDPTTGQPVVIAAGLGENGTIAAGEFLTSAREMQEIARRAPSDWRYKNIEVVLATQVIDERSGPPRILATYFW